MGLSERFEKALGRETIGLSIRQDRNQKIIKKAFEEAEGNTITDRIITLVEKGLEAERKDRKDKSYREDQEDFDWEEYVEDEPIDEDSSYEERKEWRDQKLKEISERVDKLEEKYEQKQEKYEGVSKMDDQVKQNRRDRVENFQNEDDEKLVKLMDKYEEQGMEKVKAYRKARIELFQEGT